MFRRVLPLLLWVGSFACAESNRAGRPEPALESLVLTRVDPGLVVPGSTIVAMGESFVEEPTGVSWLHLVGDLSGRNIDVTLPAEFVDTDELHIELDAAAFSELGGDGMFMGNAQVLVDYSLDGARYAAPPIPVTLTVASELRPTLGDAQLAGEIFVNDPIAIEGDGFLLGGNEGVTYAKVEGCFTPAGGSECTEVAAVEVPIVPDTPFDRTRATFAFSPRIAGIEPGNFQGRVSLHSVQSWGLESKSDAFDVDYDIIPSAITGAATSSGTGASLGQFIDIDGGGFVGGDEGFTVLHLVGTYTPTGAPEGGPVDLELIGEFETGRRIRYVINEDDALGQAIDVRVDAGTFRGTIAPIVSFDDQEVTGPATEIEFSVLPVRQVVWVRFLPSYIDSLRAFGMRAVDSQIRERILAVLARDYESINIEFRTEEPTDFQLYAVIDVAGPDPNGLGLLGYDNTPGKDVNNARLFDRIGGVNALTQEDDFPGFGGVFIDSLFAFSGHPPDGKRQETATELFDAIFDPLRPDTGQPIRSADVAMGAIPSLTSGDGCPADERSMQVACAVWVLGSMIGSTMSHEKGHSLGLADPLGTRFHNLGDAPNRLMDAGGARTFEERSELMGEGPGRFCEDEYQYLRMILPSDEPQTTVSRPYC